MVVTFVTSGRRWFCDIWLPQGFDLYLCVANNLQAPKKYVWTRIYGSGQRVQDTQCGGLVYCL